MKSLRIVLFFFHVLSFSTYSKNFCEVKLNLEETISEDEHCKVCEGKQENPILGEENNKIAQDLEGFFEPTENKEEKSNFDEQKSKFSFVGSDEDSKCICKEQKVIRNDIKTQLESLINGRLGYALTLMASKDHRHPKGCSFGDEKDENGKTVNYKFARELLEKTVDDNNTCSSREVTDRLMEDDFERIKNPTEKDKNKKNTLKSILNLTKEKISGFATFNDYLKAQKELFDDEKINKQCKAIKRFIHKLKIIEVEKEGKDENGRPLWKSPKEGAEIPLIYRVNEEKESCEESSDKVNRQLETNYNLAEDVHTAFFKDKEGKVKPGKESLFSAAFSDTEARREAQRECEKLKNKTCREVDGKEVCEIRTDSEMQEYISTLGGRDKVAAKSFFKIHKRKQARVAKIRAERKAAGIVDEKKLNNANSDFVQSVLTKRATPKVNRESSSAASRSGGGGGGSFVGSRGSGVSFAQGNLGNSAISGNGNQNTGSENSYGDGKRDSDNNSESVDYRKDRDNRDNKGNKDDKISKRDKKRKRQSERSRRGNYVRSRGSSHGYKYGSNSSSSGGSSGGGFVSAGSTSTPAAAYEEDEEYGNVDPLGELDRENNRGVQRGQGKEKAPGLFDRIASRQGRASQRGIASSGKKGLSNISVVEGEKKIKLKASEIKDSIVVNLPNLKSMTEKELKLYLLRHLKKKGLLSKRSNLKDVEKLLKQVNGGEIVLKIPQTQSGKNYIKVKIFNSLKGARIFQPFFEESFSQEDKKEILKAPVFRNYNDHFQDFNKALDNLN